MYLDSVCALNLPVHINVELFFYVLFVWEICKLFFHKYRKKTIRLSSNAFFPIKILTFEAFDLDLTFPAPVDHFLPLLLVILSWKYNEWKKHALLYFFIHETLLHPTNVSAKIFFLILCSTPYGEPFTFILYFRTC